MDSLFNRLFSPIEDATDSEIRRLGLAYSLLLLETADADGEFAPTLRRNLLKVMPDRYALNPEEKVVLEKHFFGEHRDVLDVWGLSQSAREGLERLAKWKVLDEVWQVVKRAQTSPELEDYILQKLGLLLGVSLSEAAESRVRVETGLDAS